MRELSSSKGMPQSKRFHPYNTKTKDQGNSRYLNSLPGKSKSFVPPDRIKGEGREEIKTESESNAQHNTQSNNSCLAPLLDSCPSISTFSPNTDLPPRLAADPLWYPNTLQCKTYNPTYYFPETMCGHYRYTQDLLNLDMHSRNTSRLHHVS